MAWGASIVRAIVRFNDRLTGSKVRYYENRLSKCSSPRTRLLLSVALESEKYATIGARVIAGVLLLLLLAIVWVASASG